jgi:hypothetical protein
LDGQSRDALGILTERPGPDDRIVRVDVDVHGRRKVDVDANRTRLAGDRAGNVVRVFVAARGGDRHCGGKCRRPTRLEQIVREHGGFQPHEGRFEVG